MGRSSARERIEAFKRSFEKRYKKREKKKKRRYPRDEGLYNLCQENEFFFFLEHMPVAAMCVAAKHGRYCGMGRPPRYSLYDILVCLSIQRYFHLSLRRSMGVIRFMVKAAKLRARVPCFKTLNVCMNDPSMKCYADEIIELTSKPARLMEEFFATDSTGVATFCFAMWFMLRMKRKVRKRDHITAHVTTAVRTNVVTAVDVDCERGKDSVYFREHVRRTAGNFSPKEWSGDSAYLSRENCNVCRDNGIEPYFRLKENTTARARSSPAWKDMVNKARADPEEYGRHYHRRSNVESTNSAKTRKFGGFVRAKNDTAKENEEMFGWACYNFTALARAYYQYRGMLVFDW